MFFPDLEQLMIVAARVQEEHEKEQLQRLTGLYDKASRIVADGLSETFLGKQRKVATMFQGEVRYQVYQTIGEGCQPITVMRGGKECSRPGTDLENDTSNQEGIAESAAPQELALLKFDKEKKSFVDTRIMGKDFDLFQDCSHGLVEVEKVLGLWDQVLAFKERRAV